MEENIGIAFELLMVGMVTVFTILFLVVIVGNLLIRIVNAWWPESEVVTGKPARKASAIAEAVRRVTDGKGRIVKIEKI
jgi:oxaloacetate decarboxylase gamma subunit